MDTAQGLLRRIDDYLNAAPGKACDVETVGPFTLFFRRDSAMPELSYARPTASLEGDLSDAIAGVRAAFAARERVCRWEFVADLVPDFPATLVQHGFPEPIPRPLMVVTRETFRPEQSDIAEIRPIRKEESRAIDRVLQAAFAELTGREVTDAEFSDETAEEAESLLDSAEEYGYHVFGAFVDGRPVAGGVHTPVGDTAEVAGIGTLPAFRRRGIAGALTSALVADAFARGIECIFLSAADEAVQRVYARVGFEKIGNAMDTADRSESATRG
jgi:ribosomal protein S18 acetylase RimI-like enzyme